MKPSSIWNPLQGHTHNAQPHAYNVVWNHQLLCQLLFARGSTALTTPGYIIYKHADVDY